MSLTVGEIIARRKLKKQSDEFYEPGQHRAVAVEDKALLTWVDGVGRLIMLAAHQDEDETWVIVKPAHVISIGLNGQMATHQFAASYRFDEKQVNALNDAIATRDAKKKPKDTEPKDDNKEDADGNE